MLTCFLPLFLLKERLTTLYPNVNDFIHQTMRKKNKIREKEASPLTSSSSWIEEETALREQVVLWQNRSFNSDDRHIVHTTKVEDHAGWVQDGKVDLSKVGGRKNGLLGQADFDVARQTILWHTKIEADDRLQGGRRDRSHVEAENAQSTALNKTKDRGEQCQRSDDSHQW